MPLYTSIADFYDRIFPVNEKTVSFVGVPSFKTTILDIGCATGGHCLALAQKGWAVTGIDPSAIMIQAAEKEKRNLDPPIASRVRFKIAGMQELNAALPDSRFDMLLCTGNTVPHLSSQRDLKGFFGACRAIMPPGGEFIIQILNYAKILREKPAELPLIQGEGFIFSRRYRYLPDGGISFETEFETAGKTEKDATRLWPFTPADLLGCALETELKVIDSFGSWDGQSFGETDDVQLILRLRRR